MKKDQKSFLFCLTVTSQLSMLKTTLIKIRYAARKSY